LSFLFRLSTDGRTVLVPQRRRFRDRQQLLLVAEAA
jgi:ribosomal protein L34